MYILRICKSMHTNNSIPHKNNICHIKSYLFLFAIIKTESKIPVKNEMAIIGIKYRAKTPASLQLFPKTNSNNEGARINNKENPAIDKMAKGVAVCTKSFLQDPLDRYALFAFCLKASPAASDMTDVGIANMVFAIEKYPNWSLE